MISLVFGFLIQGCSGPYLYPRAIHEEKDRYVRLEARYGHGQEGQALRFTHPLTLSEGDWARILASTYVKPKGWLLSLGSTGVAPSQAFDGRDRTYLAERLASAFSRARPDEWVVFYLSHPREAEVDEITSGGFFVVEGQVHLVLANYRQPVSMSFVRREIWNDPLRPSGKTYYEVVPQEYQTVETYVRWYPNKPLLAFPSELLIDYVASLNISQDKNTTTSPGATDRNIHNSHTSPTEDRLRSLGRLHDEGLITDEEYQAKRAKLLDEL